MGREAGNNVMDQQVVMIKKEKARMKTKQNIHKSQLLWLPKLFPVPFDVFGKCWHFNGLFHSQNVISARKSLNKKKEKENRIKHA